MRVLGLTGSIGTGKSTVARMFEEAGVPVVDADAIAREVVLPGRDAWRDIVARFGEAILLPGGEIDRRKLGALVFSDPRARADLGAITHPRIREGIEAELSALEERGCAAALVEAALIFENRREGRFEAVIGVRCDRDVQVRRIVERDGVTEKEAAARIAAQMDPEDKARRSAHVIDNSGTPEETRRQVLSLVDRLGLFP